MRGVDFAVATCGDVTRCGGRRRAGSGRIRVRAGVRRLDLTRRATAVVRDAVAIVALFAADLDAVTRLCVKYELLSFNIAGETMERRLAEIEADPEKWQRHRREVEDMLFALTRVGYRVVKIDSDQFR